MKGPLGIVCLMIAMSMAIPETSSAAASINSPPATITEFDCARYSITRKEEQLADLETELAKLKRRSPRRQYTAGIESQINTLRFELQELQKVQQHR